MALTDMPPEGPIVQFPNLSQFATSGIYFLRLKGEVVYVGQAGDMRSRIATHIAEGVKAFDAVSCRPCPRKKLNQWERYFIERLLPKYNRCAFVKLARLMHEHGGPMMANEPERRISEEKAAEMLGINVADLRELGPKKIRLPRCKARVHHTAKLRQWAEENPELLAELQAKAA